MKIPFAKMHSLGNDFVVIDAVTHDIALSTEAICRIADRHFGVGCDQILVLELPKEVSSEVDFTYRIFNADGSEAGQCCNGVRCLAKFIKTQGISEKKQLIFTTKTTKTKTFLEDNGQVTAIIQGPMFEPKRIPLIAAAKSLKYNLQIGDGGLEVGAVSVGNPHAVVLVDDVATAAVDVLGPLVADNQAFPEKANVNFMQILDRQRIKLRVCERGSGETLACGSGACASVVIGRLWGFLESKVVVELRGGELVIMWNELDENILITGPAELVFFGEINLKLKG